MSLLEFDFMRRALLAAALVGFAAPSIGVYLVQRRMSLMGDGVGHVAFAGVAAGILTGASPVYTAIAAAGAGAVVIELLRERGRMAGDLALALIFYGGIAAAVLLTSLAHEPTTTLFSFLFGSVLLVSAHDVVVAAAVAAGVLAVTLLLRKELFAVCYDEEVARAGGLPVRALNMLIAVTTAVTVAVTMRVVGILLVASLLVLPVATSQQLTRSFKGTTALASGLGLFCSVGGLVIAFYADVAPSATIALLAILLFAASAVIGRFRMGG